MGQRVSAGSVIESKYRLERELGSGGMGSVWLATQLMVDRPVAVKLLHPAFVDQDDLQARFEVEAKAIGRLNHPNVITLYDFGFSEDLKAFYTVIEYIDGESLDKRLDRRMHLSEIVAIVRQIALALDHAHHHSILHRDLKPENVMLAKMTDGSEIVKVLDFGIARIVKGTDQRNQESQRITKAGEVFGTPAYMSPEQARSVRQLEPPADLYSLGVMFYELVAGGLPFFAHSAFDLLMLHVTKPVPPIRRKDVPEDLAAIIYKLLEKEPEKRFQSGKALVEALDAIDVPKEDAPPSLDDLDDGPTMVQRTPAPNSLQEETNPQSPDFYLPTPSDEAPFEEDQRRPTMMLDSDSHSAFSTGSIEPSGSNRMVGIAALGLVAVVVAALVAIALTKTEPMEAAEEPTSAQTEPAEVTAEENQLPPEIADAMEKESAANDPLGIPPDEDRVPAKVDQKPKPKLPAIAPDTEGEIGSVDESEADEPTDGEAAEETGETVEDKPAPRRKPRPRRRPRKTEEPDPLNIRLTTDDDKKGGSSDDKALNKRMSLD